MSAHLPTSRADLRAMAGALGKPALFAGGLVGATIALNTLPITETLRAPGGDAVHAASLVAIGAIACAIGVPRQLVAFAAGYAWGLAPAIGLALAAQMLGCAADLFWARAVGRHFVRRHLKGRIARFDAALAARPFTATLALRLLPIGNNLALNLLAGVASLRALPFLAASALGYLPQTAIFALIGHGGRLGRGTEIAIGAILLLFSALLGAVLVLRDPTARFHGPT